MNTPKKNRPTDATGLVPLYDQDDFVGLRKAGQLAAETLDFITPHVKAGISTGELDTLCHQFITDNNAIPAPLNYKGFPKSICTSINHVVCHGIPDDTRILKDSDVLNIDVTVILDGYYGDTSRMFFAGDKAPVKAKRLTEVTYQCLERAIAVCRPGATLGDIGHACQSHAEANRFSVVTDFCGHGIGDQFHHAPSVLHYGTPGEGLTLTAGMVFTIEPMINAGKAKTKVLPDGWTAVTSDRSLSAQCEHTLAITHDGCEIFTNSPKGLFNPIAP